MCFYLFCYGLLLSKIIQLCEYIYSSTTVIKLKGSLVKMVSILTKTVFFGHKINFISYSVLDMRNEKN